jgi:hypothetical protein
MAKVLTISIFADFGVSISSRGHCGRTKTYIENREMIVCGQCLRDHYCEFSWSSDHNPRRRYISREAGRFSAISLNFALIDLWPLTWAESVDMSWSKVVVLIKYYAPAKFHSDRLNRLAARGTCTFADTQGSPIFEGALRSNKNRYRKSPRAVFGECLPDDYCEFSWSSDHNPRRRYILRELYHDFHHLRKKCT